MKKQVIFALSLLAAQMCMAQNPVVQTKYTADPAPMVHNDTVFLYTTHDEDDADGFKMYDWLLYSSTDMLNWTDHGAVASLKDWVDALKHMCVDYPEIAMGVRRKGKRLEECIVKILQYSFKNQVAIPQKLVEKALPNFHQKVSLGVPCMKQVKQIIRDYYMGE